MNYGIDLAQTITKMWANIWRLHQSTFLCIIDIEWYVSNSSMIEKCNNPILLSHQYLQERERLFAKFHPHSAANAINSTRKNGSKNTSSPSSSFPGILKKTSHRRESIPFNPSSFPGRLTMKSAFRPNVPSLT